jgi:putative phosphoesterase
MIRSSRAPSWRCFSVARGRRPRTELLKPAPPNRSVNGAALMRVAIVSDIHGNLTAFEAVLTDLRQTAPDLVMHAGDLADGGSSPIEILGRIREMGWPGVVGNGDEMLCRPQSLEDFARQSSAPPALWEAVRQMAAFARTMLGAERLSCLSQLPLVVFQPAFAVLHASPHSCWQAPSANAPDSELERVYGSLSRPIVVFGHTHLPFVRRLPGSVSLLINAGSVGLPYDGDPRASYLLLDDATPSIRRVWYDLEREVKALESSKLPHAAWVARILRSAAPQMP